jgi:NAD(P)H dehydrogenase (quinone)
MKVAIVYHSGFGHTKIVAESIAKGIRTEIDNVALFNVDEDLDVNVDLQDADTIVFGSPTYFGNVSAAFKKFMESTGNIWFNQLWKNKLAAGFTNSATRSGDKLNTLTSLALFAAQHGMVWIPLGVMPVHDQEGNQMQEPNGLGSYMGLMTISSNSNQTFSPPSDLKTAELFGQHIGQITKLFKSRNLDIKKQHTEIAPLVDALTQQHLSKNNIKSVTLNNTK